MSVSERRIETRLEVLAVRFEELDEDVTALQQQMREHSAAHDRERLGRQSSRRWLAMAAIAAVGAIDGPIVAVLLAMHGGH